VAKVAKPKKRKSSLIQPGDVLNGYKVGDFLSHKGGMSVLYLVNHSNPRLAAVPLVLKAPTDNDAQSYARIEREAHALSFLTNCRNVVRIQDSGHSPVGTPYIIEERLEGEDLDQVMRREGKLTISRAVEIAMQALLGLHACHLVGVHHRDVKPANIFLHHEDDAVETVKMVDFGIAHTALAPPITGVLERSGTTRYMSPEQAAGTDYDSASDQFSMAVVLFECLTGESPWPKVTPPPVQGHEAAVAVALEHQRLVAAGAFRRLRELRPDAPEGLEAAISRALSPDPKRRFASAYDFAAELSRFATSAGRVLFERYVPSRSGKVKVSMIGAALSEAVTTSRAAMSSAGAGVAAVAADAEYVTVARAAPPPPVRSRSHRIPRALGMVALALAALAGWRWYSHDGWFSREGAESGLTRGAGELEAGRGIQVSALGSGDQQALAIRPPDGADSIAASAATAVEHSEAPPPGGAKGVEPAPESGAETSASDAEGGLRAKPPKAAPVRGPKKAQTGGVRFKNGHLYSGGKTAIVD
jgi:serine/threonine protein kinase